MGMNRKKLSSLYFVIFLLLVVIAMLSLDKMIDEEIMDNKHLAVDPTIENFLHEQITKLLTISFGFGLVSGAIFYRFSRIIGNPELQEEG